MEEILQPHCDPHPHKILFFMKIKLNVRYTYRGGFPKGDKKLL